MSLPGSGERLANKIAAAVILGSKELHVMVKFRRLSNERLASKLQQQPFLDQRNPMLWSSSGDCQMKDWLPILQHLLTALYRKRVVLESGSD